MGRGAVRQLFTLAKHRAVAKKVRREAPYNRIAAQITTFLTSYKFRQVITLHFRIFSAALSEIGTAIR